MWTWRIIHELGAIVCRYHWDCKACRNKWTSIMVVKLLTHNITSFLLTRGDSYCPSDQITRAKYIICSDVRNASKTVPCRHKTKPWQRAEHKPWQNAGNNMKIACYHDNCRKQIKTIVVFKKTKQNSFYTMTSRKKKIHLCCFVHLDLAL